MQNRRFCCLELGDRRGTSVLLPRRGVQLVGWCRGVAVAKVCDGKRVRLLVRPPVSSSFLSEVALCSTDSPRRINEFLAIPRS
jgi:hypothetical protein